MKVAILKYNAGNIQSVSFALKRVDVEATVTDDPDLIEKSDKVIFPGVGEASTAMNYLKQRKLDELIVSLKQPVLGICLGMQLLCRYSEENQTNCLGIFEEVTVKKFKPDNKLIKVPQVGWNNVYNLQSNLFSGVHENSFCYFVHGYYAEESNYTVAKTNYVLPYSSALQKDNFYGVQFHPEKSADIGEKIIKNFLSL